MNRQKFYQLLKRRQIKSVLELAGLTFLHRNTINHYLAGGSVYQAGFQKIAEILHADPLDLIEKRNAQPLCAPVIAQTIDQLHARFPELTFVLLGSRAKGTAKKYSDWDIGFLSGQKITHQLHLDVLKSVDDLMENQIDSIDIVNLNLADDDFLAANKESFIFLTGKMTDWINFISKLKKL